MLICQVGKKTKNMLEIVYNTDVINTETALFLKKYMAGVVQVATLQRFVFTKCQLCAGLLSAEIPTIVNHFFGSRGGDSVFSYHYAYKAKE